MALEPKICLGEFSRLQFAEPTGLEYHSHYSQYRPHLLNDLEEQFATFIIPGTLEEIIHPNGRYARAYAKVAVRTKDTEPIEIHRVSFTVRINTLGSGDIRTISGSCPWDNEDSDSLLYAPIDPFVIESDILQAHHAFPNAAGDAFEFGICHPDEQIEFAEEARLYAFAQFQQATDDAIIKLSEATNAVLQGRASEKASAIMDFAEAVSSHVYATVIAADLGAYHGGPHNEHKRSLTVDSINHVLHDWAEKAKTDLAVLNKRSNALSSANTVITRLSQTHVIKTRSRKAAEAAAKAAAEESSTQTPEA